MSRGYCLVYSEIAEHLKISRSTMQMRLKEQNEKFLDKLNRVYLVVINKILSRFFFY